MSLYIFQEVLYDTYYYYLCSSLVRLVEYVLVLVPVLVDKFTVIAKCREKRMACNQKVGTVTVIRSHRFLNDEYAGGFNEIDL
jgi:hypothetical protein